NGTVKIGDPTGRDESRPVLTDAQIEQNWQNWKRQASTILDFDSIKIMYNGDWLEKLRYTDLITLLAKTTVQQLLERDMFQERIAEGKPIHGHEIIYPLLQGYDSVAMDVDLELGGSDQTFNMLMGRTLQKIYRQKEKWVLTTPIINGTDGRKMSKSLQNFVALTDAPDQMYGKLMSVQDGQIVEYLTLLTDLPDKTIEEINIGLEKGDNPMKYKMLMAHTITTQLHSKELADQAQRLFVQTFQNRALPDNLPQVRLFNSTPSLLDVLKLCKPNESSAQLKRLCAQKAVRLMPQGQVLSDPAQTLNIADSQIIKIGKREFFQLQPF
ncbi:MAG TPA: tyrosine--tRNA ligase, partial [Candidatus Woesebacteria bacterium]|nr:tyrosine--tRNA ligase [Candidatus Woesebacteria bacterium]